MVHYGNDNVWSLLAVLVVTVIKVQYDNP